MPERWKLFLPLFLFLLALALVSAHARAPQGRLSSLGTTTPLAALSPISFGINWVAEEVEGIWRSYFYLVGAREENARLRQTLARARQQAVEMEEVRATNERLTSLLSLRKREPEGWLAGRVLAWDPGPWYQVVVIDQGAQDGVRPEAAVVNVEGLVGRVVELAAHEAKVLLITDRSSAVDGFIQRNQVNVLVSGLGAGRLGLEYTRKGEDARLGDLVVTSGLDGVFPAGRALGVVTQVDKAGLGLFLRAELRPTVEFSSLREILIQRSKPQTFDWTTLGSDVRAVFEKKNPRPRAR
ncbi:MAG: rod shape-determining protein MreC [Deltaproteobacteria bacterium]|jgi:rod shape-determining protein MreC|nr:rod shape-determining protein MreC [Deltaproteobacteria bacterium]